MGSKTSKTSKKKGQSKSVKIQDTLIDFNSWFWFQTQSKKLRDTQKSEIKVFFAQKGLKDRETKSRYDETLKLY